MRFKGLKKRRKILFGVSSSKEASVSFLIVDSAEIGEGAIISFSIGSCFHCRFLF